MELQYDLILKSLGLQGIKIENWITCDGDLKLVFYAKQNVEDAICHICKNNITHVHEYKLRKIKSPSLGIYEEVYIYLKQIRGTCHICDDKVKSSFVDFVHPGFKNLTYSFVEKAGRLCEETTCEAAARLLKLNPKTMWSIDQYRMIKMKPLLTYTEMNLDLEKMSADEVHFRTIFGKKSSDKNKVEFVTNLVCTNERKILSNAMGRKGSSLLNCLKVLTQEQLDKIKFFALDMHDAFIDTVVGACRNAKICIDRFHLAEGVNKVFDEVRKVEFKLAKDSADKFLMEVLAPHKRYILVEREKNLSKGDFTKLEHLLNVNKNIFKASVLVEYFHRVLDRKNIKDFRESLMLWYRYARESKLNPFLKFSKTLRKYRSFIEGYILSGLTTALSEGLNNKIKVLKRMGYGYKNPESFMNKILQRCGMLNSKYIETSSWYWPPKINLASIRPF
jgi:transposase